MPGLIEKVAYLAYLAEFGRTPRRARGIRTAGRKKIGLPPRRTIAWPIVVSAAQAIKNLFPKVTRLHLVGSRLRHAYARDLDFVAVVERPGDMPGRMFTAAVGNLKINLFFSLPDEVEPHIIQFGLGLDTIHWKRAADERGFRLNQFGLWKGPKRVSNKMAQIAKLIGMELKPHLVWSLKNPL